MDKVILVAYDLNPELGSECGIAHIYLKMYLKYYEVLVFTDKAHEADIRNFNYGGNVIFNFIEFSFLERTLSRLKLDIFSNWGFCRKTGKYLASFNELNQYKFIHIVTPDGFFAFNDLYKLGLKYIIGPINGGLKTPKNFRKVFLKNAFFDFFRDMIYRSITKLNGWNKYYEHSTSIIISDANLLKPIPQKYHPKTYQIFDVLVDPSEFTPQSSQTKNQKHLTILFSGRLIPKKGIQLLLEAYRKCIYEYKLNDLTLNIIGTGPLLNNILKFIEKHSLKDKIFVFSNLPKSSLIEKYQTADIYCLPTLREPGGLAILEAMSCGLPVITSNYGGPAYSVTSECGIKIDLLNYDQYIHDMANAIKTLYYDRVLRNRMGANSRGRIVKEFSIETVEKKLLTLWEKLES
jgi:glycosyltransferase involved in cell wall biosynthesis